MIENRIAIQTPKEAYSYFFAMLFFSLIGAIFPESGMGLISYILLVLTFFSFRNLRKYSEAEKNKYIVKLICNFSFLVLVSSVLLTFKSIFDYVVYVT